MKKRLSRRDFLRKVGIGTLGLGFGVSIFDGIYQYANALTEEEAHTLLMKGTVNFMGFMAKEITPNDEFYITTYSSKVPTINANTFTLRMVFHLSPAQSYSGAGLPVPHHTVLVSGSYEPTNKTMFLDGLEIFQMTV